MSENTITLNLAPIHPSKGGVAGSAAKLSAAPQSTRIPNFSFKRKSKRPLEPEASSKPKGFRGEPQKFIPRGKFNAPSNRKPNLAPGSVNKEGGDPANLEGQGGSEDSSSEDSTHGAAVVSEGAGKTIISSLFTRNPSVGEEHSKARQVIAPQIASNRVQSDAKSFVALGLDKVLARHLKDKMGIIQPTPVQSRVISSFATHVERDLIIQAQTGSGKTLAFLLPIVDRLVRASGALNPSDAFRPSRASGILAVVLAPTRELARQIYDVLRRLLNYPVMSDDLRRSHWIVPGLVVGGDKRASEKARLRKGVNILVVTPGRLLDHLLNTTCMNVDGLKWVVLDEGDRFLELGFQETLKSIFAILKSREGAHFAPQSGQWFWRSSLLPKRRRTIMVSATLNSVVKTLAEYSLADPMHITGDLEDDGSYSSSDESELNVKPSCFATPQQLTQRYLVAPAKLRLVALSALLRSALIGARAKVIVFMLTCEAVEFYHGLFLKTRLEESGVAPDEVGGYYPGAEAYFGLGTVIPGLPLLKLHGNLDQKARLGTYKAFCALEAGVLFCTDVAARGLDLPRVAQIIQFDPPTDLRDYVHRVGRTARLGRAGDAVLFLLPSEEGYVARLATLKIRLHPTTVELALEALVGDGDSNYQAAATRWQTAFESYVASSNEIQELAARALTSSVRAYATHPQSEKDIFHVKKLHLGHLAKSFALRATPTEIAKGVHAKGSGGGKRLKGAAAPPYASRAGSRPSAGSFDPASEFAPGTSLPSRR
ncbi:ATP-dependent RNA helicase dbp7 [Massospora cicadina]|nr:ATP-dependent RNA helicase dbp7 [Massospora cicadina]